MRIVFIGPPGSGKGTQCTRLAKHWSIPHLSTGNMLRETIENSSAEKCAFGTLVSSYINTGRLAPDYLVMPIITKRLAEPDCAAGCLFDGFPRTVIQAQQLDEYLQSLDQRLNLVLSLEVAPEELIRRILLRANTENRADDTPETIAARLQVFDQQTTLVLDYYHGHGIVKRIDGMKSPDEVFSQIIALPL